MAVSASNQHGPVLDRLSVHEQAAVFMNIELDAADIAELLASVRVQLALRNPGLLTAFDWYAEKKPDLLADYLKHVLIGAMLSVMLDPKEDMRPLTDVYKQLYKPVTEVGLASICQQAMIDAALSKDGPLYREWGSPTQISDTLVADRARYWLSSLFPTDLVVVD